MTTQSALPIDAEAELHLLGSVWSGLTLNDPEARAALWEVVPEAFFTTEYRRLWSGMRSMATEGSTLTDLSLAWASFGGKPTPEQSASVFEMLQTGANYAPAPLVARVLEFAARRTAYRAAREVAMAAVDYAIPIDEVTSRANVAFLEVVRGVNPGQSRFWSSDAMVDTLTSGAGFRSGVDADKLCWFGIPWLDDLLLCMPGNVTCLGGRPGAGKTGLALQARNVTAMRGIPAGFFSLEQSRPELDARDAAWWLSDPGEGRIYAYKALLQGHYDSARALAAVQERLPEMRAAYSWHHPSGLLIGKLIAYITEAVHAYGLKLAVVDYFQYIGLSRQKGDTLASAYGANSIALKQCAQNLNIHILLLSQLNRGGDGRPGLADLKETSQLEQDASGVPMLYWNKSNDFCTTLPKNRDGETVVERVLDVSWPCLRFRERMRETEQPFLV